MYPVQLKAPRVAVFFSFILSRVKAIFARDKNNTRHLSTYTFTSLLSQSNFKHLHMPEYTPLLFPSRIHTLIQVSVSFESLSDKHSVGTVSDVGLCFVSSV